MNQSGGGTPSRRPREVSSAVGQAGAPPLPSVSQAPSVNGGSARHSDVLMEGKMSSLSPGPPAPAAAQRAVGACRSWWGDGKAQRTPGSTWPLSGWLGSWLCPLAAGPGRAHVGGGTQASGLMQALSVGVATGEPRFLALKLSPAP